MFYSGGKMNVTEVSEKLKISFMATSRHLSLLRMLSVLTTEGKDGHVFYYLSPDLPKDFQKIIKTVF